MSRLLTAKVAVATLTAVVAVGGVAAAATVARTAAENGKAKAVRDVGKAETERGPDVNGSAKAGLCRAWVAGNGGENGGKGDATAFQALVRAAGGEDKVEAFCASTTSAAPTSTTEGKSGSAGEQGGVDASGAARAGLCKAWAAGGSSDKASQRMSAASFAALVEAAGGASNIPTFCAAETTTPDRAGDAGSAATGGQSGEHGAAPEDPAEAGRGAEQADQAGPKSNG